MVPGVVGVVQVHGEASFLHFHLFFPHRKREPGISRPTLKALALTFPVRISRSDQSDRLFDPSYRQLPVAYTSKTLRMQHSAKRTASVS